MEKEINNIIDISKQLELFNKLHNKRKKDYDTFSDDDYIGIFKNTSDIYPDSVHFIYELIQNADDVKATEISIVLEKSGLLFKHNGLEHFNVTDVDDKTIKKGHINCITGYVTEKDDEEETIGKFGVGFKSVYKYTETPEIYDDLFKFKIINRMIPVLIENDHKYRLQGETLFYFPFKESEFETSYKEIYDKLTKLVNATLFLKHLRKISWKDKETGKNQIFTKTIKHSYISKDIFCEKIELNDSINKSNILMFSRKIEIQEHGKHPIYVGYFIDEDNNIITDKKPEIYCFFPTEKSFQLCFISHAPFELTNNRASIQEKGETNKLLVEEIGKLVADSLFQLKDKKLLNSNIFDIVGNGDKNQSSLINPEKIYIPCLEKIKNNALLLSRNGEYLTINKAYKYQSLDLINIIDRNQLKELEKTRNEIDFVCREINDKKCRLSDDLQIKKFDYETLAKDITKQFMKAQSEDWIKKFYYLIVEKARTYWKPKETNPIFLSAPIILLKNNEWVPPFKNNTINVFFDIANTDEDGYNVVNPNFAKNEKVKEFLKDIGCKPLDLYAKIITKILPKYDKDTFIARDILCKDFITIFEYSKTIKNNIEEYKNFCDIVGSKKLFPVICAKPVRDRAKDIYLDTDIILEYFKKTRRDDYHELKQDFEKKDIDLSHELKQDSNNKKIYDFNTLSLNPFILEIAALDDLAHKVLNSKVFNSVIKNIGIDNFNNFMKDIGASVQPKICSDYSELVFRNERLDFLSESQIKYLESIHKYRKTKDVIEYKTVCIDGITEESSNKNPLNNPSKKLSIQIWEWLINIGPDNFKTDVVNFSCKLVKEEDGLLTTYESDKEKYIPIPSKTIEILKGNKWLYNSKGELCYPKEITKEELSNNGYSFPDNNLSELIGIKTQELDWAAAGATERDKKAHAIGKKIMDSGLSDEEIAELLRKGKEEKNKKLQKEEPKIRNVSNQDYPSRKESEKYDSSIFSDNKYTPMYSSTKKQQDQRVTNTEKEISALREKLEKENEKKIKTQELRDSVDTLQKYSKEWFDTLLQLEYGEEAINENISERAISLSFSKVEKEKNSDRVFVLKYPSKSYIPLSIEDIGGLEVKFSFTNKEDFSKSFEVASVKDFTLRLKAKQADLEFLNGIDWTKCVNASININNPVQLMSKLITAFNELDLPANYNLKNNLKDNISFVFGPPATGKSTFLSNEIKNLIDNNSKCKILVLCPTNKACDVLTQKIMDIEEEPTWLGRFVATGSEKIENEGFVCDRDSNIYLQDKCCLISTIARLPYDGFKPDIGLRNIDWDYIIIDEASMIPLVQIVYAIYNFSPKSKIIIAGDPLQISPIVREEKWKNENIYKMVNLNSFDQPKTEPIQFNITNLKKQYRSISSIGHLFSKYAYNDLLEHDRTDATQMPLLLSNINIKPINLIAFRVSKYSDIFRPYKLSGSNIHLYSVLFVTELFKFISSEYVKNNNDKPIKIGIICPYVAEAQMIEKLVEQIPNIPNNIEITVGTIHGFQGDECDIIFVVFNPSVGLKKSPDKIFINNKNIINVAISRARDYLFIFFPDKDTEGFENLVEIKKLGNIACENPENVALFTADEIEKVIFEKKFYIENNVFVTTHQLANVYTQTAQKYEIRIDENSVDIQMDSNLEK